MNRVGRRHRCAVCDMDMKARFDVARTVARRAELSRQIESGICDGCQVLRQRAAIAYERASNHLAMITALGNRASFAPARWSDRDRHLYGTHPLWNSGVYVRAIARMQAAERRCVGLKMWPHLRAV